MKCEGFWMADNFDTIFGAIWFVSTVFAEAYLSEYLGQINYW